MGALAWMVCMSIWGWYQIPYSTRDDLSACFWTVVILGAVLGATYDGLFS